MKSGFIFVDNSWLTVRWGGTVLPELERELERLFAKYGLEFSGSGYNFSTGERTLEFRPSLEEKL